MKKVYVHNGQFHLDELMAIAIYESFVDPFVDIIRGDEPVDDGVWLDVGGQYNGVDKFDHHQDRNMDSACLLLARKVVPEDIFVHLEGMLRAISECDRGVHSTGPGSLNVAIRNFNSLSGGFEKGLMVVRMILEANVVSAKKAVKDVARWHALERIGRLAILEDTDIILDWKRLAQVDGVLFLVCPNARGSGWHLISRDTEVVKIPTDTRQKFRHVAGFMATYTSKDDAIAHGRELS